MKFFTAVVSALLLALIVSMGTVGAYEPTSFKAGSAQVYGQQVTYPGTGNLDGNGASLQFTIIGDNNQLTIDQGAQRGGVVESSSSAGASRTPVAETATATRRSSVSGCEAIDCDMPTAASQVVTPVATPTEGDVCLMPPYNPNDVNDKTKFWYYIGTFINCPALTIDDAITVVKIPLRDTLVALQGTAVSSTSSAEVGEFVRSKWIGPLITTSDNELYAFTISDNGGKCVECFQVQFYSGTLQLSSLGWAEIDFSGSGAQIPAPSSRVNPASAYMIV